eukprot:TRINITY_DN1624_c0_g1_i1.p1 TRINITY_DN1624_c0_g1~~TRINITY_DN1624_c0_g1_i1.p1  ORF type:complete len:617 (+),score=91.92 TRINITY_DN1624_c0_g1_i1:69-1853(+)
MSLVNSSSIRDKKKKKKKAAAAAMKTEENSMLSEVELPKPTLTDSEIEFFVREGYLVINNAAPPEINKKIIRDSDVALKDAGFIEGTRNHSAIGNNIAPAVPELIPIVMNANTNKVSGALASLLGSDYILHKHLTGMNNDPGSRRQNVHKDNFAGFNMRRSHTPWWCMVMYYPQDTTISLAATSVVPRTQYIHPEGSVDERHLRGETLQQYLKSWNTSEQQMEVPAGSCVIVHKDIFHRGMDNTETRRRWMFKYEVLRQSFPLQRPIKTPAPTATADNTQLACVHEHVWNWIHGCTPTSMSYPTSQKISVLGANCDMARLQAAYSLRLGDMLDLISNPSFHGDEMAVRAVRHGLSAALYYNKEESLINRLLAIIDSSMIKRPLVAASCLLAIGESGGVFPESVANTVADYICNLVPPRGMKTGQHNVMSHAILALGLIGTLHESVRKKARTTLTSVMESAALAAKDINADPSRLSQGEFYMEAALACVRITVPHETDDKFLSAMTNAATKIAQVEVSNDLPRLPGRGGGAGADQGLRYTMGFLMTALAKSCNNIYISRCYSSLKTLNRLGNNDPDMRTALLNRWCHLTNYYNGF